MISNQESLNLSPYMAIYDILVPKDNMLRQIGELVDFTFILDELKSKYCHDNGRIDVATSTGLFGMQMQGAMAIFAVNLKRILTLMKEEE